MVSGRPWGRHDCLQSRDGELRKQDNSRSWTVNGRREVASGRYVGLGKDIAVSY